MDNKQNKGEMIIYNTNNGKISIDVRLKNETIWLNQKQMANLFDKDTDTIGLHIKNIFKEGELEENPTTEELSVVQIEGKRKVSRQVIFYNLDVIISVGYRVNSIRGTQFRIWATNVLKNHIINGFSFNEKRMEELEKSWQTQKESNEKIRYFFNKFLGDTARKDVIIAIDDKVDKLRKDSEKFKKSLG